LSRRRAVLATGLACAIVALVATYLALPGFRALLTRHHWILYLYVGVFAGLLGAGAAALVQRLSALRRPGDAGDNGPPPATPLLFGAFLAIYLLTAYGRLESYDAEIMFRVTESMLERRSFVIRDEMFGANEPYSVYGLGLSLFAVPFHVAGKIAGVDPRWAVSLLNSVITALAVACLYRFARDLGFGVRRALWLSAAFGLGSLAWPYSRTFFSEPAIGLLLLVAAWSAWHVRRTPGPVAAGGLGLALGLAVLTRTDSVLVFPLFALYLAWPPHPRWPASTLVAMAVPLVLVLGLAGWYHLLRFDDPVSGATAQIGHSFDWRPGSLATATYGLLISSGKGLAFYSPIVLLALPAWPLFRRRAPLECLLFSGLFLERTILFSAWSQWHGGICWGPRFLVPVLPFLILPIGYWLGERVGMVAAGTLALSILVQLPGVTLFYGEPLDWALDTLRVGWHEIYFVPRYSPIMVGFELLLMSKTEALLPIPSPVWQFPVRVGLAAAAVALGWQLRRSLSSRCAPAG
jgi:hypothetical protein